MIEKEIKEEEQKLKKVNNNKKYCDGGCDFEDEKKLSETIKNSSCKESEKETANNCEECNCYLEEEEKDNKKSPKIADLDEKEILNTKIKELETNNYNLEEKLKKITQDIVNNQSKYQADLDNLQKRIQKEKTTELKYASMKFINELLVPLEQFGKVLEISTDNDLLKKFLKGFQIIQKQIQNVLEKEGVEEIKALGEKFNPEFHHAIEKISDKEQPNYINIEVLQKGFLYKDLVLKPAMVKINKWSEENNENK